MGQKHLGVTVNRFEPVCHKRILPATMTGIWVPQICNSPHSLRFNLSCAYGLVAGGCVYSVM
jgi:hypothetical protein